MVHATFENWALARMYCELHRLSSVTAFISVLRSRMLSRHCLWSRSRLEELGCVAGQVWSTEALYACALCKPYGAAVWL